MNPKPAFAPLPLLKRSAFFLRPIRVPLTLSLSILAGACTHLQPSPQANPEPILFHMNGRMAVNYLQNQKKESMSSHFEWQNSRQNTQLTLTTPVGTALALIEIRPELTSVKTIDGQYDQAPTPEALTQKLLGYPLPLQYIHTWLGQVDRDLPAQMSQDGWQVQVEKRYHNPRLAKQILISRQTPSPLTVKILVDERSDAPDAQPQQGDFFGRDPLHDALDLLD